MGVKEYDTRTGEVREMGLDADEGLPAKARGVIKQFDKTFNELLALVDCSAVTGNSAIYGWNGRGWHTKFSNGANDASAVDCMYVSSAVVSYRIWFAGTISSVAQTRIVRYQPIPSSRIPPSQLGTLFTFRGNGGNHFTPWFTVGPWADGIALKVKADVGITVSGDFPDTFSLYYQRDWVETDVTIETNILDNIAAGARSLEWSLPSTGDAVGVAFRAIRLHALLLPTLAESMPDLRQLALEFIPLPRAKRRWNVVLDVTGEYDNQTPDQQRSNIYTARDAQTLVGFSWRPENDPLTAEVGTFVKVFNGPMGEMTGREQTGYIPLTLVEV